MRIKLDNLAAVGVIKDQPAMEIPIGAWSDVNNVTFRDGTIQKSLGNTEVHTGVLNRIQWMIPYEDPGGNNYWVYAGIDDNGYGKLATVTQTTHANRTRKNAAAAISDISVANPTNVTIASTTYNDGDEVVITGSDSTPSIDGTHTLTKVSATVFTIDVNVTVQGTTGSASIDSDYSPSATIPWTGGELNGLLVINNGVDTPQKWDRTTGTLKADFEDLANWPAGYTARVIRVFRDFLIAMDVDDGASSPSRNPFRLMWSDVATGFTEPSTWTAAATNLAGDVYLAEGGDVIKDGAPLRGNFIIYKNESTYVMRYVGGNAVMQVDKLFSNHGILAPRCFAAFGGGMHFVVTKGDIIVHDGNTAQSIADARVRNEIFDNIDTVYYQMAFCTPYYKQEEIWFSYSTGIDAQADKAAIWNYKTDTWTFRDLNNCSHISYGFIDTTGTSNILWSTVSGTWAANTSVWNTAVYTPASDDLLMAERGDTDTVANASFQQADSTNSFDGAAMDAYARMEKIDIPDAVYNVKFLRRLYPKVKGGPVRFRVGGAMSQQDPVQWSEYLTYDPTQSDYKVDCRETWRFLALEISSAENVHWQMPSIHLEIEPVSDSR